MFSQHFTRDLDRILKALASDGPAIGFARFHDGEYALLRKRKYKAASGWQADGERAWIREPLMSALTSDLDGLYIGISDITTVPDAFNWYARQTKAPKSRITFATLFSYANHARALRFFRSMEKKAVFVGCTDRCDIKVPSNASMDRFDVDAVIDAMLDAEKPVFLAAGPAACILVHRYWQRTIDDPESRQHVIDVGAAIDPIVHGRETREFHRTTSRLRNFEPKWSARRGAMDRDQRADRPAQSVRNTTKKRAEEPPQRVPQYAKPEGEPAWAKAAKASNVRQNTNVRKRK